MVLVYGMADSCLYYSLCIPVSLDFNQFFLNATVEHEVKRKTGTRKK